MPNRRSPDAIQPLFSDAVRRAQLTGQPFRDALLDVAAESRHYVLHAQIPWVSWLTPVLRRRFSVLRRQLKDNPQVLSADEHPWIVEADHILTSWEYRDTLPEPRIRLAQRHEKLRQKWLKKPLQPMPAFTLLPHAWIGWRQMSVSIQVMYSASSLMVGAYTWVAARVVNIGCMTCDDLLLVFLANFLAPVALFAFFLQPPRKFRV